MVIKLEKKNIQSSQQQSRFTLKDIEELFVTAKKNWKAFFDKNETKFWKENIDVYQWCVFPLHYKEGRFYRCTLHPMIEVDGGNKKYNMKYQTIHYSEFISHCIFYAPEEHKQYIIEKLNLK